MASEIDEAKKWLQANAALGVPEARYLLRTLAERDAALAVVWELVAALTPLLDYHPSMCDCAERLAACRALTNACALLDQARPARATAEKG